MNRSKFMLQLALENKVASVSDNHDVSIEFRPQIDNLETSPNLNEKLTTENLLNSPLEGHNNNFMQSEVTKHAEGVFQDHNISPILPIADSIIYDKKTNLETSTFSNISFGSFSIFSDSQEIIDTLKLKEKLKDKNDTLDYSICFFEDEQNNRDTPNILPTIDSVHLNETAIEKSTSETYFQVKPVGSNSVIGDDDEIISPANVPDLEKIHYDDFQDFESSGSEYNPSELSSYTSSPSSSCESLQDFDKTRAKKRYHGKKCENNISAFSTNLNDIETFMPSKETNNNFIPEEKKQKKSPLEERHREITHTEEGYQYPLCEEFNQRYIKKSSARERPTICPLCFEDVVTHFPRHLFRHHQNNEQVKQIKKLKPGSKERLAMVAALRKQGYFHLKVEKNVLNPTRTSNKPNTDYFVCTFCLGHYTKELLYKHVKICKQRPENITNPGRKCLSASQTFLASAMSKNQVFLNTARIKNEVFEIMRADDISLIAKTDPLICLYGEYLLVKHKRQQIAVVVSNKMREMARLLKEIRATDEHVQGFFDLLKPEMFEKLIYGAKVISGYNANEKSFKAPSLAMHMGTNLKQICDVAFKVVLQNRNIPNLHWVDRTQKKTEIKDIKKLVEGHWCNELSSLALKTLQEKRWKKPTQLPIANDILVFQTYLNELAETAYDKLSVKIDVRRNYKILAECVLSLTVMFNRKRVGEVQYLTIETYNNDGFNVEQQAFSESLTAVEKILSKKFKRIVTGGKGSKPVPILFSKRIQKYIACLIEIRERVDLVPKTNPYLFANPGSKDKWMAGANIIRRLAKNSGAQEPTLLTSTRFRKHIATTLQLMTMQADEMEQIATFMGHTQKTHAEFYRLPQDVYQTAKVAKVLLLLEKGKGKEFKGKSLNEIQLDEDVFHNSDSEAEEDGDDENSQHLEASTSATATAIEMVQPERKNVNMANIVEMEIDDSENNKNRENGKKEKTEKKKKSKEKMRNVNLEKSKKQSNESKTEADNRNKNIVGRIRWSNQEKELVLAYFKEHIQKKITPKKGECEEFLKINGKKMLNKDWVRIKTLVYNVFRQK